MNLYRCAAVALATCAAALSLAACSAGVTTAAPPAASSRGTSAASPGATTRPTSSPTASRPAASGAMIQVSGAVGRFPVPNGAKVAENITSSLESIVIFGSVSPAEVSAFYAQALPKAGYTISGNSVITESGNVVAAIQFAGHGLKGNIDALAKFTGSGVELGGLSNKNVTTVSFQPK